MRRFTNVLKKLDDMKEAVIMTPFPNKQLFIPEKVKTSEEFDRGY